MHLWGYRGSRSGDLRRRPWEAGQGGRNGEERERKRQRRKGMESKWRKEEMPAMFMFQLNQMGSQTF